MKQNCVLIIILLILISGCNNKQGRKIAISYDNIGEKNLIYNQGDTLSASIEKKRKEYKQILYVDKYGQRKVKIGNGSEIIGSRIEELQKTKNGWIIKRTPILYDEKIGIYFMKTPDGEWINYDLATNNLYYEYYWISKNVDTIKGPFSMIEWSQD